MALKVYGMLLSPNVVRVIAALNEKGLDFEFIPVDLRTGAHKKPDFLAINPFGQVPAFEDGDIKIFESRAINRYIALRYKETGPDLLPAKSPAQIAAVETWLEVEAHQFSPPVAKLSFEVLVKPMLGMVTDQAAVDAEAEKLGKVLDVYEERLSKEKYFAGGEFTLVDVNHMPYVNNLMMTPKADLVTSRPHLKAWWEDVSARPAWQKTLAAIKA